MPTVREYEAAMERNAADTEAFVALRKAYRQAQKHDKLVMLYERRAQAIEDNAKAGELFYLAAELRIDQLGDAEGAEADLVNAVDRDPTHIRAAARLKDIYREQGRTADYMTMLEMEAAAVARTRDPARIAELEAEMSQLFLNHFARLERAVRNPQRTGKLAQEHVRSIESARKIYRALGDFRAVVRLYELELEGTQDARRRADLLLGLGRVLGEKLEELDAAAQRVAEVVRLRPRDEKALELLAGFYANPNWIGADGSDRAAAIYYQLARRRQEASDTESAIAALRRALAAVPGHAESSELLERVYYDARRFQDLDRYYRERVSSAAQRDRADRLPLQACPAAGGRAGRRRRGACASTTRSRCWSRPGGPASEKLVELYSTGQEYAKLAELRERQLGAIAEPQRGRTRCWSWPTLYRDRLGDRDQAAVYLHAVLEIEPENQLALGAYADHFREKGDWAALADLLEFSYERARLAGISSEELLPRLEEIATVSEKQLGDPERAIAAWQRAEEIAPTYARAREAQRRLLLKAKSWDRLAALLEREAAAQQRSRISAPRFCGGPPRSTARSWGTPPAPSRSTRRSCAPTRGRGVDARRGRDLRARGRLRQPGAAAARADRPRDHQAGAGRVAAPGAGDLRRADRRPRPGAVGGERDPAVGARRSRHADAAGTDPRARQQAGRAGARCWSSTPATPRTRTRSCRSSTASADILRGPLQDPAGGAARLEEVVRHGSGRRQGAGRARRHLLGALGRSRTWRASWTCRSSASSPTPAEPGGVPAAARPPGRGTDAGSAARAKVVGAAARICCRTIAEALEALARIAQRRVRLAHAGPASSSGRCRWPRSPAAPPSSGCSARRSSTRRCTTTTRRREALEQPDRGGRPAQHPRRTTACAATTRPTRTGRASSRWRSGRCS